MYVYVWCALLGTYALPSHGGTERVNMTLCACGMECPCGADVCDRCYVDASETDYQAEDALVDLPREVPTHVCTECGAKVADGFYHTQSGKCDMCTISESMY